MGPAGSLHPPPALFRRTESSCWARYPKPASQDSVFERTKRSIRSGDWKSSGKWRRRRDSNSETLSGASLAKRWPTLSLRLHGGAERTCTSPPVKAFRFQRKGPPAAQRLRNLEEARGIGPLTPFEAPGFRPGRQAICHRFRGGGRGVAPPKPLSRPTRVRAERTY